MALHPVACALDGDDVLVISGAKLTSTKRKWSLELPRILVAVHFVAPEALPAHDATPFRSAAITQVAIAIDAFGAVHAVDPAAGTLLFSLPEVGAPVDVAASDRQIAIATRERIVRWSAGKQSEIKVAAKAIAFGPSLAFATDHGVFVDDKAVATSSGDITDLAAQPDGSWLIGSAQGLFTAEGRLLDGAVRRVAVDHKCVVLQRSETMIAVYSFPQLRAVKRIHYPKHTIVGFALSAGELVVALEGGRIERINLTNGESKLGTVEDARVKSEGYLSGRIGNRRGVVAIIPVAAAAGLCLWTYLHPHGPTVPTRHFGPLPKLALPACDAACENERIDGVIAACDDACVEAAKQIKAGFGLRQCTSVRLQLEQLADSAKDPRIALAAKSAQAGLASACLEPPPPKYQLLGFRPGAPALSVPPPNVTDIVALDADETGNVYVAAALPHERCEIYRRAINVDTQWTTILTVSGCGVADLYAKRADAVYFRSNTGIMRYDGTTWSPANVLDPDVMAALDSRNPSQWSSADGQAFRVEEGVMWRSHDHGTTWARDDIDTVKLVAGRSANDVYAGGAGGLFHFDGKQWSRTLDAPVDRLATSSNETWVIIEAK